MFIATRVTNGVIALFALLISALFFLMGSEAMRTAAIFLALVPVFFLLDLLFRKKSMKSDMVFAGIWTSLFAYNVIDATLGIASAPHVPPELGGTLIFSAILYALFGTPLLLNGIYLVRLYRRQRQEAVV